MAGFQLAFSTKGIFDNEKHTYAQIHFGGAREVGLGIRRDVFVAGRLRGLR